MRELLDCITKFEGLHKKIMVGGETLIAPYSCPANVATIGYGHTGRGVTLNMTPITLDQAQALLERDVQDAMAQVLRASPILRKNLKALWAVTDFVFNCGIGAYRASTLKKRIDNADWQGAAVQVRRWIFGGGRKLPGLVARREIEANWLMEVHNGN